MRPGVTVVPYDGPWFGLDQVTRPERLPPGWLRGNFPEDHLNVENVKGQLRPRGGYRLLGDVPIPNNGGIVNRIISLGAIGPESLDIQEDLSGTLKIMDRLLVQAIQVSGTFMGQFFLYVPMMPSAWALISTGHTLKSKRATYISNGGWTIIATGQLGRRPHAFAMLPSAGQENVQLLGATTSGATLALGAFPLDQFYAERPHLIYIRTSTVGAADQARIITGYIASSGVITIDTPWITTPAVGDTYDIMGLYFREAGLEAPDAAPTAAVGGAGIIPAGDYTYRITYYDSISQLESNPSPVSNVVSPSGVQDVTVMWTIPDTWRWDGPGPRADGSGRGNLFADYVRVYRRDETAGADRDWQFIGEQEIYPDVFTDNVDFPPLTFVPVTHGVPPNGASYVVEHQGRAFYAVADSRTIWYSELADGETGIRGSEYVDEFSFGLVPAGGVITGLWSTGNQLIVFQQDGAWEVETAALAVGESLGFRRLGGVAGCASHFTIAEGAAGPDGGQRVFYANDLGVHEFNGAASRNITQLVIPDVWKNLVSGEVTTHAANVWYGTSAIFDPLHNRYMLFTGDPSVVVSGGGGQPNTFPTNILLMYGLDANAWTVGLLSEAVRGVVMTQLRIDRYAYQSPPAMLVGLQSRRIGVWSRPAEEIFLDDDVPIPWVMTFGRMHFGNIGGVKKVYEIKPIFSEDAAGILTVEAIINFASTAIVSRTFDPADPVVNLLTDHAATLYVGAWCRHLSMRLSSDSAVGPFELVGVEMHVKPKGIR